MIDQTLVERLQTLENERPQATPEELADSLRADGFSVSDTDIARLLFTPTPDTATHPDVSDRSDKVILDPGFDGDQQAIRAHYERVQSVYESLGRFDDGASTFAVVGHSNWYKRLIPSDLDAIEEGWKVGKAYSLVDDWEDLIDKLAPGDDRTLHNLTSWKTQEVVGQSELCKFDDEANQYVWESGENPLPDYEHLRGYGFWVDLDLADDISRADLSAPERKVVEDVQEAFITEVADLYEVPTDAVFGLDSGGGAYIYGPPEAAKPLAEYVDDAEERRWVFEELTARLKTWTNGESSQFEGAWPRICDRISRANELLDPDIVQNKNHQSKAPMAIHADHDLVVTPLRPRDTEAGSVLNTPNYTPTLVSDVDDDLIAMTETWADGLTAVEHESAVESLVRTLWPEYAGEHDDWQQIIDAWLEVERVEREKKETRRTAIQQKTSEWSGDDDIGRSEDGLYEGLPVTTDYDEVLAAVDTIDVRTIIQRHACDGWDTSNRSSEVTFNPSWRDSASGKSCAVPEGSNVFIDNSCDGAGGPAKAFALGEGIFSEGPNAATRSLSEVWGETLDAMRAAGYNIPVWIPDVDDDDETDSLPYWALRRAAVALGVCEAEDLIKETTDDGETYRKLPDSETYSATLDALEAEGVAHGLTKQPVSNLPTERLKRLTPDEAKRYATSRGLDWPDTDSARDRLETKIHDVLSSESFTVLEAPTSLGKSYTASTTRWRDFEDLTGNQPVVMQVPTHEIRTEAKRRAENHDLEVEVLKGYKEACPVASGKYDPDDEAARIEWDNWWKDPTIPEFWQQLKTSGFWIEVFEHEREAANAETELGELTLLKPRLIEAINHILGADFTSLQVQSFISEGLDSNGIDVEVTDTGDEMYRLSEDSLDAAPGYWKQRTEFKIEGQAPSEFFEQLVEHTGLPASVAHSLAEDAVRGELPCTAGERRCELHSQWEDLLRDDDGNPQHDLIVATHNFAHVPSLRLNTNLIFDEQPTFTVDDLQGDGKQERIQELVEAYLRYLEAPVQTWEEFVTLAKDSNATGLRRQKRDELRNSFQYENRVDTPSVDWFVDIKAAHTIAPALTKAIWQALGTGADTNGRYTGRVRYEPPRFDATAKDEPGWNVEWVTVVLDESHSVQTVREAPDVSQARSVVGLDAWPSKILWERNVHPNIELKTVLDPEERQLWRRIERGLQIVQVGENTRPRSGKEKKAREWFDQDGLRALVESVKDELGVEISTGITTAQVEVLLKEALIDAGADAEDVTTIHYGNEKGVNEFKNEDIGLVVGSMDPGDDYVLNLLAESGLSAEPKTSTCTECDGNGCSKCDHTGIYREHGREFVGDDADAAHELLETVRAYRVAQAAGRYARSPDDPTDNATVFVRTSALPDGFADVKVPDVEWVATDNQERVIDALRHREWASARELAEATGLCKEHVRQTLVRLEEHGKVNIRTGDGDYGANLYEASDENYLYGIVDLDQVDLEDIANEDLWDSSKWSLAICADPDPPTRISRDQSASTPPPEQDHPPNTIPLRTVVPGD